jgi:glycosyltransferase involved in cell wall biosynthesis
MKTENFIVASPSSRILFLTSSAFNSVTGGGITFTNLFKGWPLNALATVHSDPVPVARGVCEQYFRLSVQEVHRWGWLRYIPMSAQSNISPVAEGGKARQTVVRRTVIKLKTWLFGDGVPQEVCLSEALEAWVSSFRPTLLYTILGSNEMMELAEKLRVRFSLPLVVHIMDDWPSVIYRGGLFSFWQRRKKDRLLQHLMNVAAGRFAICQDMAEAYEVRYKKPFQWFQNAIDVAAVQRFVKNPLIVGSPIRVAYLGSVFPNAQLQSLIDCCTAVQALHHEGLPIRMEIYSPSHATEQYRERLVVGTAISLQDNIADDEVFFRTLQGLDMLVLPVNFDEDTIQFIRYSMPTKVPAYLAVGTPILVYGPAEVAQVSYATKAGWGMTVTVRDMGALKDALMRLATDMPLRQELSDRARQMAAAHHDARVVREQFQAALSSASASNVAFS